MKAILLAAGKGTRISRMIEQIPKCILPINGVPLIRYTVEMLMKHGIECCVCVGYEKEHVYKALEGIDITYYYNPFFDVTNSIASLWFARDFIHGDLIIMNADVYISEGILDLMLNSPLDNVMAIDTERKEIGDYFFGTTGNGILEKYGKDLPLKERSGEYVGMAKVAASFVPSFFKRLEEMIDRQEHQKWWENVLYSFTQEKNINTLDVGDLFWAEVDYFDDYERILKHIEEDKGGQDKHRIYERKLDINTQNTLAFYNDRAKKAEKLTCPYTAVLLGDQNPEHAEKWDLFEKEQILPQLKLDKDCAVLDIGCGMGRWAEAVIPDVSYYVGTDFSGEMIKIAQKRCAFKDTDYDFLNISFQELVSNPGKYLKRKMNRVIIGGVCMYINDSDLAACINSLDDCLDEHCIMYFTETVAVEKRLTLAECPSKALKTTYDVIYRTPSEYNEFYQSLIKKGFKIIKQEYLPHLNNEQGFSETERWFTMFER